jgi:hypothetical protein
VIVGWREPGRPAPAPDGRRRRASLAARQRRAGGAEEAVVSEESVPQQGGPTGRPKGLLQQMEELMAALNADLSDLHKEAGFAGSESQECARGAASD